MRDDVTWLDSFKEEKDFSKSSKRALTRPTFKKFKGSRIFG